MHVDRSWHKVLRSPRRSKNKLDKRGRPVSDMYVDIHRKRRHFPRRGKDWERCFRQSAEGGTASPSSEAYSLTFLWEGQKKGEVLLS